ncbi:MAG: PAS domain-containing protein [Deltaproteobacteria bacterium]|nr:PAS domain-containing protein [Deltaproteobacteria bacterium]
MKESNGQDRGLITRGVLDNIDEGIIALGHAGRIALFNPAAQLFTGVSEKQALGRPVEELFARQPELLKLVRTVLASGRSISDHREILLVRPGTSPLPVRPAASPLYQDSGEQNGAILVLHDLSRVKELEKAMRQADRLAMLGVLAAGLAHEIKNPLGGIKGAAQLLDRELEESSALRDFTRLIIREAERVNGIIEELMDLARPRPARMEEVQLARLLNDVVLLQRQAHRDREVTILLDLDPSIPPIRGDENHLTQMLVNLIKNAAEAVGPGGQVEVVCRVSHDFNFATPGNLPGPVIVIEVKDNGPGLSPEEIERVFTPFYSTKAKGSGLGLAICQKIAEEHGALLKISSEARRGSVFSVTLPFLRPTRQTPRPTGRKPARRRNPPPSKKGAP